MTPRVRFAAAATVVALAIGGLITWSLVSTGATTYYKTPAQLLAGNVKPGETVRVAGKVVDGSIKETGGSTVFLVTDGRDQVEVRTSDVLPDTFGAGVEVVAEGALASNRSFNASTVLAKCPSKFKSRQSAAAE